MKPLVLAVDMGYGHLRAARALARAAGTETWRADQAPLAGSAEALVWRTTRLLYEGTSRLSQAGALGAPWRLLLDRLTAIQEPQAAGDPSAPGLGSRIARALVGWGMGGRLRGWAEREDASAPLLSTFYLPALAADRAGCERVFCAVTDADLNRVWVATQPERSRITYFAATDGAARRLRAYGVRAARIEVTGFALPGELLGGRDLIRARAFFAARRERLERAAVGDGAPLVTFAVGGAGAQASIARRFLPSLAPLVKRGEIRLALLAGTRPAIARRFARWLADAGLGGMQEDQVRVVLAGDLEQYFDEFNDLMAATDILWTKPSELVFYGALGIPLVLAPAIGAHERENARWAIEQGMAAPQGDPAAAGEWLPRWLRARVLAAMAEAGYHRVTKLGTYRMLECTGCAPSAHHSDSVLKHN